VFQVQLDTGRADFRAKYEAHKAEKERQRLAEMGRVEVERQRQVEMEKRRQQVEREREAKQEKGQDRGGPSFSR
jgi:hypothetical protein